jgi:hypothetical protein
MADLGSGRYYQQNPVFTATGVSNLTTGIYPGATNLAFHGAGALTEFALTTKKEAIAAIPVEWGWEIRAIAAPIAGTEGEAASETFVALYAGAAVGKASKLLGQGKAVTAAVVKEKLFTQELEKAVLINEEIAPNKFVYAAINTSATTPAAVAGWKIKPLAIAYATGGPVWGGTVAQKAATEAAAEWTVAGAESVPWLVLS